MTDKVTDKGTDKKASITLTFDRLAFAKAAEGWVGTPFHHGARIKGAGVDCAQLLIACFVEATTVAPPMVKSYSPDWFLHEKSERLVGMVENYAEQVKEPVVGSIALFTFGRSVSHAGIVVELGKQYPVIVHAFTGRGVVREPIIPLGPLGRRLAGFWNMLPIPAK